MRLILALIVCVLTCLGPATLADDAIKSEETYTVTGTFYVPPHVRGVDVDFLKINVGIILEVKEPPRTYELPDNYLNMTLAERQAWLANWQNSEKGKAWAEEYQQRRNNPPTIPGTIDAVGRFRIENVPKGSHHVSAALEDPSVKQFRITAGTQVRVEGGDIDLPHEELYVQRELVVPDSLASDFEFTVEDGQTKKLSDYRGQFVLVDFWATWCGPCVAETPNLIHAYNAVKNRKDLVVLGISLDDKLDTALKYAKEKEIEWTQGFIGMDRWEDPTIRPYTQHGIPQILLIGPDGKVIEKHLRGENILKALQKHVLQKLSLRNELPEYPNDLCAEEAENPKEAPVQYVIQPLTEESRRALAGWYQLRRSGSIEYELEGENVVKAGSYSNIVRFNNLRNKEDPPQDIKFPKEDVRNPINGRFVLDLQGKQYLMDLRYQTLHGDTLEWNDSRDQLVVRKGLISHLQEHGQTFAATLQRNQTKARFLPSVGGAIFVAHGILLEDHMMDEIKVAEMDAGNFDDHWRFSGHEEVRGRPCIVVVTQPDKRVGLYHQLWIDGERRTLMRHKRSSFYFEVVTDYDYQLVDGRWLISGVRYGNESGEGSPNTNATVTMRRATTNPKLSDDSFDLTPPPNTYLIDSGGLPQEYVPEKKKEEQDP